MSDKKAAQEHAPEASARKRTKARPDNGKNQIKSEKIRYENADQIYE